MIPLCVFLSPDQGEKAEKKHSSGETGEEDRKPRRKAYVHKPFLYSRYYSDSDDEITVEERRRSAVSYNNVYTGRAPFLKGVCQLFFLFVIYILSMFQTKR